jgi:ABC-2 type transport system ATP-binding protein
MIVASHLTRRFGARVAVDDVSFEVGKSEIVALLGPNGAGKTTTMRMLAGLIAPSAGHVTIGGVGLSRATGGHLRNRMGFLTESPGLWDRLTVRENLRVYANLYGLRSAAQAVERAIELFELADCATSRAAELSKGMRQKVALGRALIHDPTILILDEPTSGLDPEITRSVRRLLEERRAAGCAVVISTHNLDEAERLADRVAVLSSRLVAIDRPGALRRRLTTGRLILRVDGEPARFLDLVKTIDPHASIDGPLIVATPADLVRDTPAVVGALVAAGARVLEVRPEVPALEDVYVHLLETRS